MENKLGQKKIDIKQTKRVVCEECGNEVFTQAFMFQEVSPLMTGTGQKGLVPVTVFACTQCGHVNKDFMPQELKDEN